MIEILAINTSRTITSKVKIDRELLWYDHKKHKMEKFTGGKLAFVYKYDEEIDEHRLLPETEDVIKNHSETITDSRQIDDWFELFSNYNQTKAIKYSTVEEGVIFSVPDDELENFTSQLERECIQWKNI